MNPRPHRLLLISLGLAFAALVVAVVAFYPSGEPAGLPNPLEGVSPLPDEAVVGQVAIAVDLPAGYELALVVDGMPIPLSEVYSVPSLGTFRWQPGPASVVAAWEPGAHTVEISWNAIAGRRPDPGAFSWTFRVT